MSAARKLRAIRSASQAPRRGTGIPRRCGAAEPVRGRAALQGGVPNVADPGATGRDRSCKDAAGYQPPPPALPDGRPPPAGGAAHADRRLPRAGQSRWVVHAIGELPAAQGTGADEGLRAHRDGQAGHDGAARGLLYLADIGDDDPDRQIDDDPNDSAVVEAVGDLIDSVKQAVNSVVDAIEDAVGSIGAALAAAVNFARTRWRTSRRHCSRRAARSSTSSSGPAARRHVRVRQEDDPGDPRRRQGDVRRPERDRRPRRPGSRDGAPRDRPARPHARRAARLPGDARRSRS